jgi:hypothetical protein
MSSKRSFLVPEMKSTASSCICGGFSKGAAGNGPITGGKCDGL